VETFDKDKDLAAFCELLASTFAVTRKLGDLAAEHHGKLVHSRKMLGRFTIADGIKWSMMAWNISRPFPA
jgi:hypothetical protein